MVKINKTKFDTFKSDAAPFFFFIDVIPPDLSQYTIKHHIELLQNIQFNPIMPLPLRVDRVNNGVLSTLIRPRTPISFSIGDEFKAIINPSQFMQYGIEKLLNFSEIRVSEQFASSLSSENVRKWWNNTRFLYGRLKTLEEDFTAFLNAYLHFVLTAKLGNLDLINAAKKYCEIVRDICNKRINEKYFIVEKDGKEKIVEMYKMKEGRVQQKAFKFSKEKLLYPAFIDVELIDTRTLGYDPIFKDDNKVLKKFKHELSHIPLLIYDDLLECMLQNLKILENFKGNILDPSFLLQNQIILLVKNSEYSITQLEKYTWFNNFDDIDINSILSSIKPTFV